MRLQQTLGAVLAVETNDLDMLRMILSKTDIPVDARIDEAYLKKWTLLEFALMLGHRQCAEVLLRSGATIDVESCSLECRLQQIQKNIELITEECRFLRTTSTQNKEKQVKRLEKRLLQMRKMKTVLENTTVPGPLSNVEAVVSASDQLTVSWEDVRQHNTDLIVKYKVEWSLCDDFNSTEGSLLVDATVRNYAVISKLKHGLRYSVRVSAASIGGYGQSIVATPQSLLLSIFPKSREIMDNKKKGSIKSLFAGSFRSLKKHRKLCITYSIPYRGIYLVSIIYSEMKVCTVEDYLPVILIDQTQFCIQKDEMYWAIKLSLAWDEVQNLQEANNSSASNSHFRSRFIDAAMEMHSALGVKDIGRVHYQPVVDEVNSVSFIVTVRFVSGSQTAQSLTTRWLPLNKIIRKRGACQAIDILWAEIFRIINFFESSHMRLQKGLYICYMKLENPHITKEEWDFLRSVDIGASNPPTSVQFVFHTALISAVSRLLSDLEVDIDLIPNQRIYRLQVFQLQFGVSFIILLPRIEDVCTVSSYSLLKSSPVQKGCLTLPLKVFEAIHLCTYSPDFIGSYCRLSLFIEHFSTYIQYEQRNSLLEKDFNVYADVLSKLEEFQQRLENIWKSVRWVGDIASTARDKQAKGVVPMKRLLTINNEMNDADCDNKQGTRRASTNSSASHLDLCNMRPQSDNTSTNSLTEPWFDNCFQPKKIPTTRVIKVYAAYQWGLTCDTSVRLQIASTTTANEIVALVIEQLAKAAAESGKAIESKDPEDFCLAVVVGSRERRLRDDFPPMKLQNPWDNGRLFVRRRDSVLAALQKGNEAVV
uniref:Ankyrin repeat and fibronectin type-III domain-containing protein 1 n=1 Tax=Elaeophora elaphi TaxID=1147741 RepID=A0A0R3RZ16_9BILA